MRDDPQSDLSALEPMLRQVRSRRPLSRDEERRLAVRVRRGDARARRELVERNFGLVLMVVHRYAGRGVALADLAQEGNIGLLKAVEQFDPRRGTRFSTYAVWWISAYVRKVAREGRGLVRVPPRAHRTGRAEEEMERRRGTQLDVSLSEPGADGTLTALDELIDEGPAPDEVVGDQERVERLRRALEEARAELGELGWDIVQQRLLAPDDPCTLEEIGRAWGVSRERVRQVELKTKQALRLRLARFAA